MPASFLILLKEILERDGGEGLVFFGHPHAFFGFHRLVEPVGPSAAGHEAPREFVDDNHFPSLTT
jgi:hypothetical protein